MTRSLAAALALGVILALTGGLGPRAAKAASPFADWAAVVVAGDYRAHSGEPSEAFDNARRDVGRALIDAGFDPANLREFSVRPERYPAEHVMVSDPDLIGSQLANLTDQAKGGCLVYFSSHGSPDGVVVGTHVLSPAGLSRIVDDACGDRPTVVVVSACYSGVFVPPLSRPDRMVLTAARPDRSSFGCSSSDRYPYFDACMLQTLPQSHDFAELGRGVQACVAAKEVATGMAPPSEPQMYLGPEMRAVTPFYPLEFHRTAGSELPRGRGAP